ncbi:Pimeloyl-ACP methyl ester carboxylesterase [Sanguibacter gelidistatuariae]|uniref:Pimeloyl-ACP methyl ester carboxylesterase n=1 Tax=Sanguibacter gelidistatuariae TaxID=1814289 RepID=A0A1G6H6R6_9MICO|nr:alpha/beta hydrolase [Sanguibacter gelidistatuariae]SDB89932.1 Pimeloyl-ACP methyl ester carboxylesterase [Sanguibacter gelidistatuariae]
MTYLRINGVDLYSEVDGAGDPVLLLHGGFCSLESFRAQSDALVPDYRVFAFERPGHGRSADIDEEFSYARGVADTIAYLDAQGLDSVHVIGYSDGAIIGLLLALQHPERVRSLVAISANLDPSGFTFSTDATQGPMLQPVAPAAPTEVPAEPEPDVERASYGALSPDGPEHADVVLDKLFRLWTSEPRIDPGDLASITSPVLVMSGDRDTIRPDHSLLIAASIPGAQLCIVPGTSHGLVAERPELISTLIREFLR